MAIERIHKWNPFSRKLNVVSKTPFYISEIVLKAELDVSSKKYPDGLYVASLNNYAEKKSSFYNIKEIIDGLIQIAKKKKIKISIFSSL